MAGSEFRIPLDGSDPAENEQNEALIHQWRDIFRMKAGDELIAFNAEAGEWKARFISLDKKKGAMIGLIEQLRKADELQPKRSVSLYMAIIKNSNFDLVVEKATELGVSHIIPVMTERTVKTNLNFYRLSRLATEASEQSGRISPPEVHEIMQLRDAIAHAKASNGQILFGHIDESDAADSQSANSGNTALFIGPEGGWSDAEISLFQSEGIMPISLGQFVLRAETAAIVGVSKLA